MVTCISRSSSNTSGYVTAEVTAATRSGISRLTMNVIGKIVNNIADIKFATDDFDNALKLYNVAYAIRRNLTRPQDATTIKETGVSALGAGKSLHCLGMSDRARRYYDVYINSIFLAPSDSGLFLTSKAVLSFQSIAWAYHQESSHNHARYFYDLSLKSAVQLFGENHVFVSRILNQLGNLSFEVDHLEFALACYQRGFLVEDYLRLENDLATTMSNIAQTYESVGCIQESLRWCEKLVARLNKASSNTLNQQEDDRMISMRRKIQIADALLNIARLNVMLGKPNPALLALQGALHIQIGHFGSVHSAVASTLNEIGIIFGNQGRHDMALLNFEESLRIRQVLDADPAAAARQDISAVLCNIANAHVSKGDFDKALLRFQELVDHVESHKRREQACSTNSASTHHFEFSEDHVLIGTSCLEQMANIFLNQLDEPIRALSCYKKGIQLLVEEVLRGSSSSSSSPPTCDEPTDNKWLQTKSRFLGQAGNVCLILGDIHGAANFFFEAMRCNVEGGWEFDANIKTTGYDLFKMQTRLYRAAAPAA